MAQFDASIKLTVDERDALRSINKLDSKIQNTSFRINLKVNNLERTLKNVQQIERAATSLQGAFRSISSPGSGAIGDAFRVAAAQANEFFDSVKKGSSFGSKNFAKTTAGVREQGVAFKTLAANIDTASPRFKDYIQGAEQASNISFAQQLKELEALQDLYQRGITGRGEQNLQGQKAFEKLQKDLPTTKAGLLAVRSELERVQDLVDSRSTAGLGIAQNLLEVNKRLADIDKDRLATLNSINAKQIQIANTVKGNVRRSAESRAGSGFADFSKSASSNTAINKSIRRQEDRLKRIGQLEAKIIEDNAKLKETKELKSYNTRRRRIRVLAAQQEKADKRLREAGSNAIIGGAFPLLFGQGIGASVGGAAGGGLGGLAGGQFGFGLSLVGTAIGTAFDELVKSAQDTANALEDPLKNLDALNEKFNLLDKTTKKTVDALIKVGEAQKASNIVQEKISEVIGKEGIDSLRELGLETQKTAELFGELKLALEAIAAGPLSDVLRFVNQSLKVQLGRTVSENLRKDLSKTDLKEFDKQIAKAIEKTVKERFGKEGKSSRTGDAAANYLSVLAPDELLSIVETFKGARANTAENKSITSEQQIQNNITKLQRQQNTLNAQLTALSTTDKFTKAVKKQQELQTNYDKQRADILKSYEENLGNIRESVEQRILALRIQGIQKANEIENQRAANQLSELRAANRAASQQQREAAVAAGTRPELAATAQTVNDAFRAIEEAELSAEQQKAQIKRDAAFEVLKLELDGEKFKVQIAKQVSKLNLNTARRIEDINLNIARANEVTASNRFDLELAIAKLRLDVLKQEQESTRLLLVNAGALEAAQQVQTVIDAIRDERLKLENATPIQQLNPLAAVGGGGVSTAGAETALNNLIERERLLTAERLKGLDILKAANKEAELAKVTNERLENEQAINSLLIQQKGALDAQQRVLELQAEGLSEAQAVAIQRVEAVFALRKASVDVLDIELRTQLAKLKGVDLDKQDLETIEKVKKELEQIAILRGKLTDKQVEAEENAKNLNKELSFNKQLATDIGEQLSTGITDAIVGAVQGTQTLGEAFQALASDILAAVGKALILAAVTKAIGAVGGGGDPGSGLLGLLFRADGGPVSANKPYIVGERGPELYVPSSNGTIIPNDVFSASREALSTNNTSGSSDESETDSEVALADSRNYISNYSTKQAIAQSQAAVSSSSMSMERVIERRTAERQAMQMSEPIRVNLDTTVINNVEYLTVDQGRALSEAASRKARSQVFSDLKQRPSSRSKVGLS